MKDMGAYNEGMKLAKEVSHMMNVGSHYDKACGFIDGLLQSHRFIQHMEIKLFAYILKCFSENRTDERNEKAVKLAGVIKEAVEKAYGGKDFDEKNFWKDRYWLC